MITPQFSVRQDANNIYIDIKAPYIKTADVEFVVNGDVFIFSLHPYYLRLRFGASLKEDGDEEEDEALKSHASYDISTSMVHVRVPKLNQGEEFKDLDMLTKLLARKDEESSTPKPLIQELDQGMTQEAVNQAEQFDWEIEQTVPEPLDASAVTGAKYGFDDNYSDQVAVSVQSGNDLNELSDPEHATVNERIQQRVDMENSKFDEQHYLADYMEPEYINEFINYRAKFYNELDSSEREKMLKLPKKSYALVQSLKPIYLNLVGIVFGWAYDNRTTMGDTTVESAWTVGKLCPLVPTLDSHFQTLKPLVVACTRRSLAYPLYRNWELTQRVWRDVYDIFRAASDDLKVLAKVLINVVKLFDTADHCYYVYNKIWFEDYAAWVQSADTQVIRSLAHELNKVELTKADVGWDLQELEEAAMEVAHQEADSDDEE